MTELTALVAFHNASYQDSVVSMLTRRSYVVTTAATLPEFQERSDRIREIPIPR